MSTRKTSPLCKDCFGKGSVPDKDKTPGRRVRCKLCAGTGRTDRKPPAELPPKNSKE